jgi:hypothetical protein
MKYSDQLWIDSLSQEALGIAPTRYETPLTTYGHAQALFIDELCDILHEYVAIFNEKVSTQKPELALQIFRMGSSKPGIMLLRNHDKLVVTGEGSKIGVKVVRVHAYNEKSIQVLEFVPEPYDRRGNTLWRTPDGKQIVTPELVMRFFLSPFFIHGSQAYISESQSNQPEREQTQPA